jgi:hypothetical protein
MIYIDLPPNEASCRAMAAHYAYLARKQEILIRRAIHWSLRRDQPEHVREMVTLLQRRFASLAHSYQAGNP